MSVLQPAADRGIVAGRAAALFAQHQRETHKHTDRLFAGLMGFHWWRQLVSSQRSITRMKEVTERASVLDQEVRARQQAENGASLTAAVGLALTHGTEFTMLQYCAEALARHLEGGLARIWILDDSGTILQLEAAAGASLQLDMRHAHVPVGSFTIGAIAQMRKPLLISAADVKLPTGDSTWAEREGLVAFAGYPLLVDSKLVGVLAMVARHEFSTSALDAMTTVADAVAIGIDRKRAEQQVARYAQRQAEAPTPGSADAA